MTEPQPGTFAHNAKDWKIPNPWPTAEEADRRAEADRRSDLHDAAYDAENES